MALGPALVAVATLALIASSPRAGGGRPWRSRGAAARPGRQVLWPGRPRGPADRGAGRGRSRPRSRPPPSSPRAVVARRSARWRPSSPSRSRRASRRSSRSPARAGPAAGKGSRVVEPRRARAASSSSGSWWGSRSAARACSASAGSPPRPRRRRGRPAGFDPLIAAVPALVGIAAGHRRGPAVPDGDARRRRRSAAAGAASSPARHAPAADGGRRLVGRAAGPARDRDRRRVRRRLARQPGSRRGRRRLAGVGGRLPDPGAERGLPRRPRRGRRCRGSGGRGVFQGQAAGQPAAGRRCCSRPSRARTSRTSLPGRPPSPQFPPGFTDPGDGPIPAIVSRRLADDPRGVKPGETFQHERAGLRPDYRVDEVARRLPGAAVGPGVRGRGPRVVPRPGPRRRGSSRPSSFVRAPADRRRRLRAAATTRSPLGRRHQPGRGRRRRAGPRR